MRYDLKRLSASVKEKRGSFTLFFLITILLLVSCVCCVVLFVTKNINVVFVATLSSIILLISLLRLIYKSHPLRLFSPEIRGECVKEGDGEKIKLLCADGSVRRIALAEGQSALIMDGDTLLKPKGAKYPVVISRDPYVAACPKCGSINDGASAICRGCGLGIIAAKDENPPIDL